MIVRLALGIGLVAVGVVVGVLGAFVQAARFMVGDVSVPWGTVLVLVALLVLVRGAVEAAESRWGGWALFTGWLAATLVFASEMPSGSLVVSSGTRQLVYLMVGVVAAAAAATVPPYARMRRAH